MALRNQRLLVVGMVVLLAIAAAVVYAGQAEAPVFPPRRPGAAVLRVPGQYASIQAAVDAAASGDVIQLAPGTYNGNITLDKPVALVAARSDPREPANNTAILDGGSGQATVFIAPALAQRPSLDGLVIRNGQVGIEAHSPFIVENSYFYGSQISIRYGAGSGGLNRNNLYFNSTNDALHVDDVSAPLLIESNRFFYAGDDAIELDFPAAASLPPVEVDVFDNQIVGSSQDGLKLVDYGAGPADARRRVIVAGNLIAGNRRAGLGFVRSGNTNEDYSGAAGSQPVRLYNNTFFANNYGLSGGANLVAFNNIIANSISHGAWRVEGPQGSDSVIAYTLFWANGLDADQTTLGPGNIVGQDPLFVAGPAPGADQAWGTTDDDFGGLILQPGSPAIDRGVTQFTAADGENVPPSPLTGFAGPAPDLGWREAGGAAIFTAVPLPSPTFVPAFTATPSAQPTASASAGTVTPGAATTQAPPTPLPATPTASPTISAPSPGPTTVAPQVSISSVTPLSASAGETVTLTIAGDGFQPGLTVSFEGGAGAPPAVMAVQVVDRTTVLVTASARNSTGQSQAWDVRISNPDGTSALLASGFTVNP